MMSPWKQGHVTTCTRCQGIPEAACECAQGCVREEEEEGGREEGREGHK